MKTSHRLLVSIAGGFLVAVAALLYLKGEERKIHAQQKMASALVAKRFIPIGKSIKAEDVEERSIPEAYVQPMALTSLKGAAVRSRRGVVKGEQITRTNVYEEGTLLGLAWVLAPGETAVSVQLPLDRAVGGHLVPGDRVDVLCVVDRQPGWEEPTAFSILSRVRILAVNDHVLDAPVATPSENKKREMSNEAILVTLGASLESAARLVLAEEKGRVSLVLTSPLDTGSHPVPVVNLRSLKR